MNTASLLVVIVVGAVAIDNLADEVRKYHIYPRSCEDVPAAVPTVNAFPFQIIGDIDKIPVCGVLRSFVLDIDLSR